MFKAISKLFAPPPLRFLFTDIEQQFSLLPLAVKRAIQGAAPRNMRVASLTPFVDDGGDASGRGWVKGKSDLKLLMVSFVPMADAWDGKDEVVVDIVLGPDSAAVIKQNIKSFGYGYRFAIRDSYGPPTLQVTA